MPPLKFGIPPGRSGYFPPGYPSRSALFWAKMRPHREQEIGRDRVGHARLVAVEMQPALGGDGMALFRVRHCASSHTRRASQRSPATGRGRAVPRTSPRSMRGDRPDDETRTAERLRDQSPRPPGRYGGAVARRRGRSRARNRGESERNRGSSGIAPGPVSEMLGEVTCEQSPTDNADHERDETNASHAHPGLRNRRCLHNVERWLEYYTAWLNRSMGCH
jgi:hypothetical protein